MNLSNFFKFSELGLETFLPEKDFLRKLLPSLLKNFLKFLVNIANSSESFSEQEDSSDDTSYLLEPTFKAKVFSLGSGSSVFFNFNSLVINEPMSSSTVVLDRFLNSSIMV